MVRLPQDPRTDDGDERPRTIIWDGTPARAREITDWARNSALNTRFMWNPRLHKPGEARTLVEYPPTVNGQGFEVARGESAEWVDTPVGSLIERQGRDVDAPLRVHAPDGDGHAAAILEAA